MNVRVNASCVGCGLCASMFPDIFLITDGGTAGVIKQMIEPELDPQAKAAAESCPVDAIEVR